VAVQYLGDKNIYPDETINCVITITIPVFARHFKPLVLLTEMARPAINNLVEEKPGSFIWTMQRNVCKFA
jgi:hypothetical protein